jgi:branched-chain amino acid transport system ATP-binding protein
LAPLIIKDIFGIIKQVNEKGTTVLLVEQNSKIALGIADRGYVLKNGVVVLQDTCENLMKNEEIKKAYLGEGAYANAVKG